MTRLDLDPDLERLGDALRAPTAIDLARANFEQQGLAGTFHVADGEHLPFPAR